MRSRVGVDRRTAARVRNKWLACLTWQEVSLRPLWLPARGDLDTVTFVDAHQVNGFGISRNETDISCTRHAGPRVRVAAGALWLGERAAAALGPSFLGACRQPLAAR